MGKEPDVDDPACIPPTTLSPPLMEAPYEVAQVQTPTFPFSREESQITFVAKTCGMRSGNETSWSGCYLGVILGNILGNTLGNILSYTG